MEVIGNVYPASYLGMNTREYFLAMEDISLEMLVDEMRLDGIAPDFTILSIASVITWMLGKIETLHHANIGFDDCEYSSHINGEIDNLLLHASYYLGESFVHSVPSLSWETNINGDDNKAFPVVTGFADGLRMCPVDDINKMYHEYITEKEKNIEDYIDAIVLQWLVKL